jgi:peptidoglycan-N-acetylglucosamine deacetylase
VIVALLRQRRMDGMWHHRRVSRRFFPLRATATLVLAGALACTAKDRPQSSSSSTPQVRVDGVTEPIDAGMTLGQLIHRDQLRAAPGHLISVSGKTLRVRADPGRILLDGKEAEPSTELTAGDQIRVVDGMDRTEPTVRTTHMVGRRIGDPEFSLATYRTREIIVRGRISHVVVSVTDQPLGTGKAPQAVALTFDDGPWPGATRKILQVLKRFDAPATFFEVGRQVAAHPGVVQMVAAAGDEIGNHTFDHPLTLQHHPAPQVAAEMWRTTNALAEDGVRPTLFRPPGGWYDDALIQEARRQHMRVVLWDVDPKDWEPSVSAREIAHNVLSIAHAGSIILLHDGGGDAAHTVAALPKIIRGLRDRGLQFVLIPPGPM